MITSWQVNNKKACNIKTHQWYCWGVQMLELSMNESHLYQGSASNHARCKLWSRRFKVLVVLRVRKNIAISNKLYVVWTIGYTLIDIVPVCQFTVPLLPCPTVDGHRRCSPRSKVWKQRVRTISTFKEPHSQLYGIQKLLISNTWKNSTQNRSWTAPH